MSSTPDVNYEEVVLSYVSRDSQLQLQVFQLQSILKAVCTERDQARAERDEALAKLEEKPADTPAADKE